MRMSAAKVAFGQCSTLEQQNAPTVSPNRNYPVQRPAGGNGRQKCATRCIKGGKFSKRRIFLEQNFDFVAKRIFLFKLLVFLLC